MPKIDLDAIPETNRTGYPPPYAEAVAGRWYRRLAPAAGLTDFGASYVRLEPGAQSSRPHWHEGEDELLVMLTGTAVLVEEGGRTPVDPGDVCAWPKGVADGHMLVNESDVPCTFLVVGRPSTTPCHYPDIDLHLTADGVYRHKDGSPW